MRESLLVLCSAAELKRKPN